jgi:hypothetical protein
MTTWRQIWEKKTHNRVVLEKLEPTNFIFVEKTDNPDISFRRVGVNAGTIDTNIDEKSIQSHYFVKFTTNHVPVKLPTAKSHSLKLQNRGSSKILPNTNTARNVIPVATAPAPTPFPPYTIDT